MKKFARKIEYAVPPELEPFIISTLLGDSEKEVQLKYPVYPLGLPLIIYVFGDLPILHINGQQINPNTRLHVAGQIYKADCSIEVNGRFGLIGLTLHPAATYYLFHKTGAYFLNKWTNFEAGSTLNCQRLFQKLQESEKPTDAIDLVCQHLLKLLEKREDPISWLDRACEAMFKADGLLAQEDIEKQLPVSSRHFRRKFTEVVGVPPKYFCKVLQLNTFFELLNRGDQESILKMALDCGYYDQAHFINDFKRFIGSSPGDFLTSDLSYIREYLGRVK